MVGVARVARLRVCAGVDRLVDFSDAIGARLHVAEGAVTPEALGSSSRAAVQSTSYRGCCR